MTLLGALLPVLAGLQGDYMNKKLIYRHHLILKNNQGQGLTEYLILLILISVVSITAVTSLGSTIKDKIQQARSQINKVSPYDN